MKNFTATRWNQTLEQFDFESDTVNINEQAINLSNQINAALDIIAPKKVFTIKSNYVQGLSENTKNVMKERDLVRSKLRKQTMSFTERKALTLNYRRLRNKANEKIKGDKKKANSDRIKKAKSEAEMWKIVTDITNPQSKNPITLEDNGIKISDEKEVANSLNTYFIDKIKTLKENIDSTKIVDPLKNLQKKMENSKAKFELKPVTVHTVKKIMEKMKKKKSAGADDISQECLLIGKSTLAGPLTTIINTCITHS